MAIDPRATPVYDLSALERFEGSVVYRQGVPGKLSLFFAVLTFGLLAWSVDLFAPDPHKASFLTKDAPQDELLSAIRTVNAKQRYLTPLAAAILTAADRGPDLSNRELEVLRLLAQGLSNKQIAHHLRVAEDTAKKHVKSILKKLGARDRTQAATEAIQRGIIHLQW